MSETAGVAQYVHYLARLLIPLGIVLLGGCDGTGASVSININTPSSDTVPQNLVAYPGSGQVTLDWDAVEGADSYAVYWSTDSGVSPYDNAFVVTEPPVTQQWLVNGVTYYYRVSAIEFGVESGLSDEQTATPHAWVSPATAANRVNDLIWNGTRFVAVGDGGTVTTSTDGEIWSGRVSGTTEYLRGVTWEAGQFVAVGDSGKILLSNDGLSWVSHDIASNYYLYDAVSDGSQFVLVGDLIGSASEAILRTTTPDTPASWSSASTVPNTGNRLEAITWNGALFVSTGQNGLILTSPDADNWTRRGNGLTLNTLRAVVWAADQFVVVGDNGTVLTSPDGLNWSKRATGMLADLQDVYFDGGLYLASGTNGTILSSADGVSWSQEYFNPNTPLNTVHGDGTVDVVAGGLTGNGAIYTRPR